MGPIEAGKQTRNWSHHGRLVMRAEWPKKVKVPGRGRAMPPERSWGGMLRMQANQLVKPLTVGNLAAKAWAGDGGSRKNDNLCKRTGRQRRACTAQMAAASGKHVNVWMQKGQRQRMPQLGPRTYRGISSVAEGQW